MIIKDDIWPIEQTWKITTTTTGTEMDAIAYEPSEEFLGIEHKGKSNLSAEQKVSDLKDKVEQELKYLNKIQKELQSLPYSEGSIVIHKKYGVAIVQSIDFSWGMSSISLDSGVKIRIAHKDGVEYTASSELLPFTKMAESIYGK